MSCMEFVEMEPPPDTILSMPPPPLPSFLLPKNLPTNNESTHQPCFAAFMCDPVGPREQSGIELIELSRKDDTWLFILVASCAAIILLGSLLAMLMMKCKQTYSNYYDTAVKQPPAPPLGTGALGTTVKGGTIRGTMLYPLVPGSQYTSCTLGADNRMLWATLTPHGTQHYIAEPIGQDDHYEVVDYNRHTSTEKKDRKAMLKSSFENSGFVDFDYEDPTPLMDSYNTDDIDSGYQEPQNLNGSFNDDSLRTYVSTPIKIDNPCLAPLNIYQTTAARSSMENTLSKKSTVNRRISDTTRTLKV